MKTGDRVTYFVAEGKKDPVNQDRIKNGMTGTFLGEGTAYQVLIEWDINVGGHDGATSGSPFKGKPNHCWWVLKSSVTCKVSFEEFKKRFEGKLDPEELKEVYDLL